MIKKCPFTLSMPFLSSTAADTAADLPEIPPQSAVTLLGGGWIGEEGKKTTRRHRCVSSLISLCSGAAVVESKEVTGAQVSYKVVTGEGKTHTVVPAVAPAAHSPPRIRPQPRYTPPCHHLPVITAGCRVCDCYGGAGSLRQGCSPRFLHGIHPGWSHPPYHPPSE